MARKMGDLASKLQNRDNETDNFLRSFSAPSRTPDIEAEALKKQLESIPLSSGDDIGKLVTCHEFADAIRREWSEMERRALKVGRLLNRARAVIEHGEFTGLVTSMVPFSHGTANMLMRAAAAIDGGIVNPAKLPNDYRLIDMVAAMTPEQRDAAAAAGLIRPDVKRSEIVAFKREHGVAASPVADRKIFVMVKKTAALLPAEIPGLSQAQRAALLELKEKIEALL